MLSMPGRNFSWWHFETLFLFFPENRLTFQAKETICKKCRSLFSGEKKKNIIKLSSGESYSEALLMNTCNICFCGEIREKNLNTPLIWSYGRRQVFSWCSQNDTIISICQPHWYVYSSKHERSNLLGILFSICFSLHWHSDQNNRIENIKSRHLLATVYESLIPV